MNTVYHSAFGGDLVFEENESLEHSIFNKKPPAEKNKEKQIDKIYNFSKNTINDCVKLYLKNNIATLSDEDIAKILRSNKYSLILEIDGIELLHSGQGGGSNLFK